MLQNGIVTQILRNVQKLAPGTIATALSKRTCRRLYFVFHSFLYSCILWLVFRCFVFYIQYYSVLLIC